MILFFVQIFFLVLIIAYFIMVFNSAILGHDLPTSKRATLALINAIKKYKPNGIALYDLGCSNGTLSLVVKKSLPNLKVYGVDSSFIKIFYAKVKSRILGKKVEFKKQDVLDANLSDADIVYTYLWYDLMSPLEQKLQNELKQGAIVITNTTKFPNWKPISKIVTYKNFSKTPNFETLFVYIKK